jgi:hypothetical protein
LCSQEKLAVAKQLAKLGVDVIEAGFPIASPGDFEAVSRIAQVRAQRLHGRLQIRAAGMAIMPWEGYRRLRWPLHAWRGAPIFQATWPEGSTSRSIFLTGAVGCQTVGRGANPPIICGLARALPKDIEVRAARSSSLEGRIWLLSDSVRGSEDSQMPAD